MKWKWDLFTHVVDTRVTLHQNQIVTVHMIFVNFQSLTHALIGIFVLFCLVFVFVFVFVFLLLLFIYSFTYLCFHKTRIMANSARCKGVEVVHINASLKQYLT